MDHVCVLCSTLWCPWTANGPCVCFVQYLVVSMDSSWTMSVFCAVPCGVHRQLHASGGPILRPALRPAFCPLGHGVCRTGQWLHLELHCGLQLLLSPGISLWLTVTCCFSWSFTTAFLELLVISPGTSPA